MGGVYCNTEDISYISVTKRYHILLILVVLERLAQIWVEDRFGCSQEQIEQFKEIEEMVKKYKRKARQLRLEAKKNLNASNRLTVTTERSSDNSRTQS